MKARRAWGSDPELLEPEAWDCPARLSPHDCREETGPDWHRSPAQPDDLEDEQ